MVESPPGSFLSSPPASSPPLLTTTSRPSPHSLRPSFSSSSSPSSAFPHPPQASCSEFQHPPGVPHDAAACTPPDAPPGAPHDVASFPAGRHRLQNYRIQVAGHVSIPETWVLEQYLQDWVSYGKVEDALRPAGLITARNALASESHSRHQSVTTEQAVPDLLNIPVDVEVSWHSRHQSLTTEQAVPDLLNIPVDVEVS